jgi:hypothetical protein
VEQKAFHGYIFDWLCKNGVDPLAHPLDGAPPLNALFLRYRGFSWVDLLPAVQVLLAAGADPNLQPVSIDTAPFLPMHGFSWKGASPIRPLSANIDLGGVWTETVLHTVARSGVDGAVVVWQTLIEAGADPFSRNHQGRTPLEVLAAVCQQQANGLYSRTSSICPQAHERAVVAWVNLRNTLQTLSVAPASAQRKARL